MSAARFFRRESWNTAQKLGLFVGLMAILVAVGLHNPTAGYVTGTSFTTPGSAMPLGVHPPKLTYEQAQNGTKEEWEEFVRESDIYNSAVNAALPQSHNIEFDLIDWSSNGAVINYLSPIKATLMVSVIIAALTMVWVWLFSSKTSV